MARSAFRMKGSPMQRNFGIGSPLHNEKTKEEILAKSKEDYAANEVYYEENKDMFEMDEKGQYRNIKTGTTVSETRAKAEELDREYPNRNQ